MNLAYHDPSVDLYAGDALDVLAEMEPESVHMVVTSPPYWGLRKYEGDSDRVWGDVECAHEWPEDEVRRTNGNTAKTYSPKQASSNGSVLEVNNGATCSRCDAWRGSYGLEPLHDCLGWATGSRCNACYVCHTLAFLDAIRRVLRGDGVVFWNLGDSYAGGGSPTPISDKSRLSNGRGVGGTKLDGYVVGNGGIAPGLKPKDMVLIPQRIALAAQSAGWWMRSDIIWAKPNPMPESAADRPTSSYEHILMFSKQARYYLSLIHI